MARELSLSPEAQKPDTTCRSLAIHLLPRSSIAVRARQSVLTLSANTRHSPDKGTLADASSLSNRNYQVINSNGKR
jgi:hypothetical protein